MAAAKLAPTGKMVVEPDVFTQSQIQGGPGRFA